MISLDQKAVNLTTNLVSSRLRGFDDETGYLGLLLKCVKRYFVTSNEKAVSFPLKDLAPGEVIQYIVGSVCVRHEIVEQISEYFQKEGADVTNDGGLDVCRFLSAKDDIENWMGKVDDLPCPEFGFYQNPRTGEEVVEFCNEDTLVFQEFDFIIFGCYNYRQLMIACLIKSLSSLVCGCDRAILSLQKALILGTKKANIVAGDGMLRDSFKDYAEHTDTLIKTFLPDIKQLAKNADGQDDFNKFATIVTKLVVMMIWDELDGKDSVVTF